MTAKLQFLVTVIVNSVKTKDSASLLVAKDAQIVTKCAPTNVFSSVNQVITLSLSSVPGI